MAYVLTVQVVDDRCYDNGAYVVMPQIVMVYIAMVQDGGVAGSCPAWATAVCRGH